MKTATVFASLFALACGDGSGAAADAASGIDAVVIDAGSADAANPDAAPPPPDPTFTFACPPAAAITVADLRLERVASGLSRPVLVTAPLGDSRLFVVEQPGRIRIIKGGQLLAAPYLDMATLVEDGSSEQGLLGLAFHPLFADNGKFYVYYTRDVVGQSDDEVAIAELTASDPSADSTNTGSLSVLLTVTQPFANHNGGMIAFHPSDGFLYAGLGDGGSGGDPNEDGQNPATLLGSLLRIDVDSAAVPKPYGIPAGNPFADGISGAPEVMAYGLRNPWRFSFDRANGNLYIGDVGQRRIEEINAVASDAIAGANFGWDIYEGSECFADDGSNTSPGTGCSPGTLIAPIAEYGHTSTTLTPPPSDPAGNSITGGYVYRGSCLPDIVGTYFYADFSTGLVRTLEWDGSAVANSQDISQSLRTAWLVNPASNIAAFGEGSDGELYLVSYSGSIFRIGAQ